MKTQCLRILSVTVVFLISHSVWGLTSDSRAVRLCERMILSGDRQACLWQIQGLRFDSRAVTVCESIQFDSDKRDCLRVIQNRQFLSAQQLRECKQQAFDLDTIMCLNYARSRPL